MFNLVKYNFEMTLYFSFSIPVFFILLKLATQIHNKERIKWKTSILISCTYSEYIDLILSIIITYLLITMIGDSVSMFPTTVTSLRICKTV